MNKLHRYLEDEIKDFIEESGKGQNLKRNSDILIKYMGLDGNGGKKGGISMSSIGDQEDIKLTREMVRQIKNNGISNIKNRIKSKKFTFPILEKVKKIVLETCPCSAELIENKLKSEGLTRNEFRVEGILNALEIFLIGNEGLYVIKSNDKRFLISNKNHEKLTKKILSKSLSLVGHNGFSSINILMKEFNLDESYFLFVKDIISSKDELVIKYVDNNIYLYDNIKRNRLVNRLDLIFSIYKSVSIADLKKAIDKTFKKDTNGNSYVLSEKEFPELLKIINGVKVIDDEVFYKPTNEVEIKKYDKLITDYLIKNGDTKESVLEKEIVYINENNDINVKNKFAFSISLNFSPLFISDKERDDNSGYYKLIGKV